jgi:predicted O-methyltransferase YrrM
MWLSYLILLVVVWAYFDLRRRHRITRRFLRKHHVQSAGEFDELHELTAMLESVRLRTALPPRIPFPSARRHLISPDLGRLLVRRVREVQPKTVVELGSGVSTVLMAYALEQLGGGMVISLEEEEKYVEETRARLRQYGLEKYARVVHAPMVPHRDGQWYDFDAVGEIPQIDLLFIDGPKLNPDRYYGLSYMLPKMSETGVVIADDAEHTEMIEIVERWMREHPDYSFSRPPIKRAILEIVKSSQEAALCG